jgi:alkanesulfonate monooxygenase SsuD/methylene tetrahydromethanopterin reductase-like flavin-dependent oxidoreductase (luciferase family)
MEDSRSLVDEHLAILRASFQGTPVSYAGRHFQLEDVPILPKVLQWPHPPLWTAAVSPESFDWAAREGLGVLAGPFKPWFMTQQDIRRYRSAWQRPEALRIGMTVGLFCLPDGRRARQLAAPALSWFYGELLRTTAPVLERLYPGYEHFHELGRFRRLLKLGLRPRLLELAGMTIAGSPGECIARIEKLRDAGVSNLLCAIGAGALPTELVRESMECLARDVMPALRSN